MAGKKLIALFAATGMLFAAVPASGAEVSPDEYKERVEPICKTNTEANERTLKGVRSEVKAGKLKPASRQVFSAAKALKRTRAQLVVIPKPAEDAARLTKWLDKAKVEAEMLEATGTRLANGEKNAAVKMVLRLENNAKQANNLVLDYEFRYCRFNPAKFF
jgi:hypothetical protein